VQKTVNTTHSFSLTLFSTDCDFITQATAAGIDEILVDWEYIGKSARQMDADTQINQATVTDLQRVRGCTTARVLCRINSFGGTTPDEIEAAVDAGVDEIMLPMVRTPAEVEIVLKRVEERCGVGILVETVAATQCLGELGQLPLARVYVGLNDLAIERGSPSIFTALIDGTVEHIRPYFDIPFGFGGLTLPQFGNPIPCRLLIAEMVRLDCQFSFLRRSFYRDIQGRDLTAEIPRIHQALAQARERSPERVQQDRVELMETISSSLAQIQRS
jgi:hypothetical protein